MGRQLALLIATYVYEDEELRQLTAPGHDAEALAEVLRDPDIAGFEVTILVNEPHHRVGVAIGEFFRDRSHDDLTLLYFTGHGLKDEEGRLHLATADTRRTNLMFTSLSAEQIDRAMSACMSRRQVLILDCCYSGAFPAGRLTKGDADVHTLERFQGKGRTVLTASDATQYSFEGDQLHGSAPRSLFTGHLVQGLRDGNADLDGDGDITLDELYTYVHDKVVTEMPQQRPKKQENVEGRIVIARNVNWSLPTRLQSVLSSPYATERLGGVEQLVHLYRIGNETVRARAAEQLRLLMGDDSRVVSAAAAASMGEVVEHVPPAGPGPVDLESLLEQATEERDGGALEQAEEHYWSALDLAIQHRARRNEGWAWDGLGSCRWRAGDFEMALKFFIRADRIADETGDALLKAWCLHNFGVHRREHGDVVAAKDFFEQSLGVSDIPQCYTAAGWTHHQMAELAHEEGNADQEREHYAAAVRAGQASGNETLVGWTLIRVAKSAERSGDSSQAGEHYARALEIGARIRHQWMVHEAEEGRVRIADSADHAAYRDEAGS
ncbi:caspase, EACC1-associated type [Streptomyces sp. H39-C1]|uniref:caspase, EACC1-associated type n=1 Tax=Streptomyces sp. H39-C1 TaxID=3004355 RepID=UPI0022B07965|nr:tetratricopeptide repeat protein [Streptomyces sp. H39-C1]MCZ4101947.1 caspase family protein [Streptomyces sp. H39-C1]